MRLSRKLGVLLCAAPLVLAWTLVGPGMVSRADGCSGGPGVMGPGWNKLTLQVDEGLPENGVIVWRGGLEDLSLEAALAAVTVEVSDATQAAVGGTLRVVDLGAPGWEFLNGDEAAVVFTPTAPLLAGATYHVKWSIDPAASASKAGASGEADVKVAGGPVAASPPSASVAFRRERRLVGKTLTCTYPDSVGCGQKQVSFGDTETEVPVLGVSVTFQTSTGSTYQVARVRGVPGKGTLVGEPLVFEHIPPYSDYFQDPMVSFTDDVPEYCVEVTTEDLAAGTESSAVVCAPRTDAKAGGEPLLNYFLANCMKPPNAALTDAWCEFHGDAAECQSDGGCTLGRPPRGAGLGAVAVVLAGIGLARRRSKRGSRAST
jgi:hypothetical protein